MLREVAIWPTAVFSHLGTQTIELLPLYGVKESQGMPGKAREPLTLQYFQAGAVSRDPKGSHPRLIRDLRLQ